ncbi:MAG: DNA polymerase III subunit delta' [Atopobiaceae bacterium]|jgi:DNA polymerase-3 subunit delta'|nr:DNA polymerase III subunit delta' [Atopobiaceae bacterium]MCI2174174.1 DNA polymerase III subunit delta' [Atopobiaceae bacterium]MCI2206815.1 DNA polymerase III subunit delta' [Atopobiaceae bacterium]
MPDSTVQMPAVLRGLNAQPRVRDFLASAVSEGRLGHAYLFVGPPGSGQAEAAGALAKCVVCPKGGCGACDECIRVAHGTHPDVHHLEPSSVTGYLIEQVRDLIEDVSLTPVRATSKVYVLDRADLLRGASANALLKTIEEPPEGVLFILIARSTDAVLPTIVSRCQVVPFRVLAPSVAAALVGRDCGADGQRAAIALSVAGTPEAACDFLASAPRRDVRRLVVRTISELASDDAWDVLQSARAIVEAAKVPLDDVRADQESALAEESDYLSARAMRAIEQRDKRELTARERSGIMEAISAANSLLRDVLLRCEDVAQPITNEDVSDVVERIAAGTSTAGVVAALGACSHAADDLAHNVSPQLALEVMFMSVKEALTCPPSSR